MQYIINLYLKNFCKFVTSKSFWKNKVDIICHQNLGIGLENLCSRSELQRAYTRGGSALQAGITSWKKWDCNSLK